MQAIVLAGGFGTRLRARVADVPKPMAPIAGRPFLEFVLDRLQAAGCARVMLATGYLSHIIEAHFGVEYRGMSVGYSVETTPLGTGGAVLRALRGLPDEPTLALNGDTWLDADLGTFVAWAAQREPADAVLLRRVDDVSRYGSVVLDGERVTRFGEKSGSGPGLINAGIYWLHRASFERHALPESFSLENDFFQAHLNALDLRGTVTDGAFIDIGVPEDYDRAQVDIPRSTQAGLRPALFLDRDGVINVDHGYVHKPEQVAFIPGIFELVMRARAAGMAVVVVTNQAGIGRGYYSEADFHAFTAWMQAEFAARGAPIDRVYFCPDHPEHGIGPYKRDTAMRKPGPGMLLQAAQDLQIDLARSVMVGDTESDMQAGIAAGVGRTLRFHDGADPVPETSADAVVRTLDAIVL